MSEVSIIPARSILEYLYVRKLRNKVRFSMTGSQSKISYLNQLRFYLFKPKNIDLYIAYFKNKKAGYLLIKKNETSNLLTEAVEDHYRRLGIARHMINFSKLNYKSLDAEIFKTNTPSIELHFANGFFKVSDNRKTVLLRYK